MNRVKRSLLSLALGLGLLGAGFLLVEFLIQVEAAFPGMLLGLIVTGVVIGVAWFLGSIIIEEWEWRKR